MASLLQLPLKIVVTPKARHRIHFGTLLSGGGSGDISSLSFEESGEVSEFSPPTPSGIRWTTQPVSFLDSIIESGPSGIKTSEISKRLHLDPRSSYFFVRRLESVGLIESESIKAQSSNLLKAKRFIPIYKKTVSSIIMSSIDPSQVILQISELSAKAGGAACLEDIVSSLWRLRVGAFLKSKKVEEEPIPHLFIEAIKNLLKILATAGRINCVTATVNNALTPVECYQLVDTNETSRSKSSAENGCDDGGSDELLSLQKWFKNNPTSLIGIPIKIQVLEVLRRLGSRGAIIAELCSLLNLKPKGLASLMESYKCMKTTSKFTHRSIVSSITEHCGRSRRIRYFYHGPSNRPLSIKWVHLQPLLLEKEDTAMTIKKENITKLVGYEETKVDSSGKRSASTTRSNRENIILHWLTNEKVLPVTRELAKRLQTTEADSQYVIDTRSIIRIAHSLASRNLAKTISLKVLNSEQKILLLVSLDLISEDRPLYNLPEVLSAIEKEKERLSAPKTLSSSSVQNRIPVIKINRLFKDNTIEDSEKANDDETHSSIDYGFIKSPIQRLYIFHSMMFRLSSMSNMIIPSPASGANEFSAAISSLYLWEFLALFSLPKSERLAKYLGFEDITISWQTIQMRLNQKILDSPTWVKSFLIDKRMMDDVSSANSCNGSFGGADYPIRKKWFAYLASLTELGIICLHQETSTPHTASSGGLIVLDTSSNMPVLGVEASPPLPSLKLALNNPSGIDVSSLLAIDRFWTEFECQLIIFTSSRKNVDKDGSSSIPEDLIGSNPESAERSITASPSSYSQHVSHFHPFVPSNLSESTSNILNILKSLSLSFYKPLDTLFRLNFRLKPRKLISELFALEQPLPLSEMLKSFKEWISSFDPSPTEMLLTLFSISTDYRVSLSVIFSSDAPQFIQNALENEISSSLLYSFEELRILILLFILWFLFPPQMASSLFCILVNNKEPKDMTFILATLLSDEDGCYLDNNISVILLDIFPVIRSSILGNGKHKGWAECQIRNFVRSIFDLIDSDSTLSSIKQISSNFLDMADSIALDLLLPNCSSYPPSTSFERKKLELGMNLPMLALSTERVDSSIQSMIPRTCLLSCNEFQHSNSNSTLNAILTSASSSVKRRLIMYDLLHTGFISNADVIESEECNEDIPDFARVDQRKTPSYRLNQAIFVDFEPDEKLVGHRANLDYYSDELFIRGEERFANSPINDTKYSALVCQSALKSVVAFGSFNFDHTSGENVDASNSSTLVNDFPTESLFAIFGSTSASKGSKKSSLLIQIALGLKRDGIFTKKFYFGQEHPILPSRLRKACCGLSLSFADRYHIFRLILDLPHFSLIQKMLPMNNFLVKVQEMFLCKKPMQPHE